MNKNHPVLERLQEVYQIDKTFLRILEGQARHNDDTMFVNSCMQNLIEETKNQAVAAKQYIDHLRGTITLPSTGKNINVV